MKKPAFVRDHARLCELRAEAKVCEGLIKQFQDRLEKLESRIADAERIRDFVGGVPINESLNDFGNGWEADTITDFEDASDISRNVKVYQSGVGDLFLVRINGQDGELNDMFTGGKVLGIGQSWDLTNARFVALAWLERGVIIDDWAALAIEVNYQFSLYEKRRKK